MTIDLPIATVTVLIILSLVGAGLVGYYVVRGTKTIYGIIRDLAQALHDAVDLASQFKSDFSAFRAFMAFQSTQSQEAAPAIDESDEARPARQSQPNFPSYPTFPAELLERVDRMKPEEPDAPFERIDNVDVTATEDEIKEAEALEELRKVGVQTEALEAERPGRQVESE